MRTADFDYFVPPELIAQKPAPQREQARLLVVHRKSRKIEHRQFPDLLNYLQSAEVLVLNDSRVIPARLRAVKSDTGAQIELLLLEEMALNHWQAMLRPGKRVRAGATLILRTKGLFSSIQVIVREKYSDGIYLLQFIGTRNIFENLNELGEVPLPPYIERQSGDKGLEDRDRYQTVFARVLGSVAAPTAGLHFSESLLSAIRNLGVHIHFVTLHVGLATFAPVKAESVSEHIMRDERFELPPETVDAIRAAKKAGRRVIAVGSTTVRVLESVAPRNEGELWPASGRTQLFIYPPYHFRVVDALISNFHLPQSTLLMLVSAFAAPGSTAGRELILKAYAEAVREKYRFFSYGDATLII